MIKKMTVLVTALLMTTIFSQAGQSVEKTDTVEAVEAMPADVAQAVEEENASKEANLSETITPIAN